MSSSVTDSSVSVPTRDHARTGGGHPVSALKAAARPGGTCGGPLRGGIPPARPRRPQARAVHGDPADLSGRPDRSPFAGASQGGADR